MINNDIFIDFCGSFDTSGLDISFAKNFADKNIFMNPGPAISSLSTASESSTFSIINAARSLGFESIFFAAFIAPLT